MSQSINHIARPVIFAIISVNAIRPTQEPSR
jgi:hypothetical protein